ncbi:hypothetical protein [Paraneptunicella aestuarii]|nr:hypothetical protein [Paraneptunicella aestuarii]
MENVKSQLMEQSTVELIDVALLKKLLEEHNAIITNEVISYA